VGVTFMMVDPSVDGAVASAHARGAVRVGEAGMDTFGVERTESAVECLGLARELGGSDQGGRDRAGTLCDSEVCGVGGVGGGSVGRVGWLEV
jgi:hypothetical protein